MNPFARIVVGYHGCESGFAERLFAGHVTVDDWQRSENDHDCLGHGIYFWEYAPERAMRWAEERRVAFWECSANSCEVSVRTSVEMVGMGLINRDGELTKEFGGDAEAEPRRRTGEVPVTR